MSEAMHDGPGLSHFFNEHYRAHNARRLEHLASLDLPLSRRSVLEVGSGPGDHTGFYVSRDCHVTVTDAREDCLTVVRERFPGVRTARVDMNDAVTLRRLGVFEIVHCYGLLYHLEQPAAAIRALGAVCSDLLLLETCVSPGSGSSINLTPEIEADYTQSITGTGCRPTREWVFSALRSSFPYVYQTRTQPNHVEFPVEWSDLEPDGLVRIVTVSSRRPLSNGLLSCELLERQTRFA